ncbi:MULTISPECIES: preprotein translocase subunit SecG [Clostridium]|uniref:Protein-export membrane protein SecG n=1 Tax=Clostridium paridis TaxID=2803863 RepID=A0A937FI59_9CLOT|nr:MULTISPECIES: preprotein translocase subunit SecG [Clostridium]MBL4932523.1 preprotein translocase subunit SecG [Clostridium paridis]
MKTALIILETILGLAVIISVMLQPGKTDGLSGLIQGRSETFFAKNKGRTKEAMLAKLTAIAMALFAINTVILNLVK